MTEGIKTILFPVSDIVQATVLYGALLGAKPYVNEASYVGFHVAGQEIGLVPNGHEQGMKGPISYWHVDDIRKSLQLVIEAGGRIESDVKDAGWGKLVASVKDADGNVFGLLQLTGSRL